jgi:phytoene synthase
VVVDAAYARCLYLARQHYENFPVASRLLPKRMRPHVAAIYAFARIADDFADEGARTPDARYRLLDDWADRLERSVAPNPTNPSGFNRASPSAPQSDPDAIFVALADTVRRFDLDPQLFRDLLSAFRQDVETTRYETWDDVFDYCRRSANPIGRFVLRIAGYTREELDRWSDDICTGLQLVNFWQDLAIDMRKDRLYVPLGVVRAHGATTSDLRQRRWTPAWSGALADAAARTRDCFMRGRPLVDHVRGRLRWELRATWLGGMRILARLESRGFNVFESRPTIGLIDAVPIGFGALAWRRS